MSWWFDKDNKCTYQEWVDKAGGLMKFLDIYMQKNPCGSVIEFGTGNSTRVLSKRCNKVITIDINKHSIVVPVDEQGPSGYARELWDELEPESNVTFICADVLKMDILSLKKYFSDKLNVILFDLGSSVDDKYLYKICYERLKANNLLRDDIALIADNAGMDNVKMFEKYLREIEGYSIKNYPETGQFVANKEE